jgi:hypothetical protein
MNDPVDRYLNELCWAMGGSFAEQQAVRDELRAHVRDAAREFELQGIAVDRAIELALADLGDPEQFGHSLRASRGTTPLRRPLLQPEGALVLERRRDRHIPAPGVFVAAAASALTGLAIIVVYLWP